MSPGTRSPQPHAFFGPNSSALLDAVRFAAALTVALLHTQARFVASHLVPDWSANAAVCVFFVLSGFVIRFISRARDTTPTLYWIDRGSRIYSVVLPALALTIVSEALANLARPTLYHQLADPFTWPHVPLQLLANLTFITGFWGYGPTPLSNGAFWSLPFEVVFYILYGLLHFRARAARFHARWPLATALLLLAGPSIALLFPVWLLGVLLYDVYAKLHTHRSGVALAAAIAAIFFSAVAIFRHPLLTLLHQSQTETRAATLSHLVDSTALGHHLFHDARLPWLDRLSPSFYLTGSATAVALLFALLLFDRFPPIPPRTRNLIRTIADATFVLYLIHLPLGILLTTLHGRPFANWRTGSLLIAFMVLFSIAFAIPCERLKKQLRSTLRHHFLPRSKTPPTPELSS